MEKKKSKKRVRSFLSRRQLRYGWYAALLTIALIAGIAGVNVLVGAAEDKWALKIDASPNSITSFGEQTYKTLDALDQDVHVYLLFQKEYSSQLRTQLEEITAKFRARSSHVIVDVIDPVTEPNRVNKYKSSTNTATMSNGAMIVTNADESRARLIPQSELYSYTANQQTGEYQVSAFNGESKLTQGILFVTADNTPMVYLLTGHDEVPSSYCSTLTQTLASENFEVKDLSLSSGEVPLKAGDTLVILAPSLDLTEDEYNQLKTFLDNGGRMIFATESGIDMTKIPNFVKLLEYYGIQYKDGIVVEDQTSSSNWLMMPTYLVPNLNSEHDVTKGLSGARLIFPSPKAIARTDMPLSGWGYAELLTTSSKAYIKTSTSDSNILEKSPMDETGTQTLALAVYYQPDAQNPSKDTRILALGSVYTLVDSDFLNSSHNMLFTFSAFDWLVDREDSVYIRGKSIANTMLSVPNQNVQLMLSGLVVIVVPSIVLIAGIWVFMRRRRL